MKYITVVYQVEDEEKFRPEWAKIINMFPGNEGSDLGYDVSAVSLSDEVTKLQWVEEAFQEGDMEALESALRKEDFSQVKSLEDLKS